MKLMCVGSHNSNSCATLIPFYFALAKLCLMSTEQPTILLTWLREANADQRERMAQLAGTTSNYLYQIATGKRGRALSAGLVFRLEDAMQTVERESGGRLKAISARELSSMWTLAGL